jgi:LuxR family transcriptional regulator, maltose regulon positive regulatory protein
MRVCTPAQHSGARTLDPVPDPMDDRVVSMRSAAPLAPAAVPAALTDAQPPPFRSAMVPRSRLVRRLRGSRDVPIATIVAPAGYGKSTLLAEWALRDERPFAWLWPAADADAAVRDALRLTEAAASSGVPQVIVVDDAHLADPALVRALVDAGCRLPPGTMLALASRQELEVPTGSLRAHRLVVEIPARALAMTRLEAAMLFDAAGTRLSGPDVDLLVERTAGWPAALYLAALALAEADATVEDFSGGDRLVADYIRTELIAGVSDDQRAFLRRTSLLPAMTGPLCDAVLDTRGSTATLEELRRAGLPIEALDRHDLAFRYQPLLATMLQTELIRLEPDMAPVLHQRAADWHAQHGEPSRAVDHAVACRDGERDRRPPGDPRPVARGVHR